MNYKSLNNLHVYISVYTIGMLLNVIASLYTQLVFVAKMAPLSLTKYSIAGVAGQLTTMATLMCSGDPPSR